jgi:hypothetical protein
MLVHRALVRTREQLELGGAPHHRRRIAAADASGHRPQPVRGQRLGLPLRLDRRQELGVDGVADESVRLLADQYLTGSRGLLEPGRDVDGVACGERAGPAGDDLAGVDADPNVDLHPVAQLERRPNGTQRIVLVNDRDAEDRHHRVADELLDRAAVPLDRGACDVEVAAHDRPQCLRIDALAERSRAADVAEEDGHRLPLLPWRRCGNCSPALVAELRQGGILGAAVRAGRHRRILTIARLFASRNFSNPARS